MNEKVRQAFQNLCDDIKKLVHLRIEEYGVNAKIGTNTLVGSELDKSVNATTNGDNEIVFQIADYFGYIVTGRRKGWPRFVDGNTFVPAIDRWVTRKGIRFAGKTHTQTVWLCVRSIVNNGIPARPFLGNPFKSDDPAVILPFLDDLIDEWFEKLFTIITEEIDKKFN